MLYLKYLSFTHSPEWYKVSGGSPYLSLFTLYAEKALCGSERPWYWWGKTETQTCPEKKTRTVHQRNRSRDRRYTHTKNVFTPVQRSRPVSAYTRRHLLFHADWILLALKHTWQVHVCLYMLIHTVHTPWGLEGEAGGPSGRRDDVDCDKSSLTKLGEWNLKTLRALTQERWTNTTSTMNSPGKKSSLERCGAARSFIVVFGTLLLCPSGFSLSNPWQTWIQIHISTYKDLCSLTDRQGVWYPRPLPLPSHTHTHPPLKKRLRE